MEKKASQNEIIFYMTEWKCRNPRQIRLFINEVEQITPFEVAEKNGHKPSTMEELVVRARIESVRTELFKESQHGYATEARRRIRRMGR